MATWFRSCGLGLVCLALAAGCGGKSHDDDDDDNNNNDAGEGGGWNSDATGGSDWGGDASGGTRPNGGTGGGSGSGTNLFGGSGNRPNSGTGGFAGSGGTSGSGGTDTGDPETGGGPGGNGPGGTGGDEQAGTSGSTDTGGSGGVAQGGAAGEAERAGSGGTEEGGSPGQAGTPSAGGEGGSPVQEGGGAGGVTGDAGAGQGGAGEPFRVEDCATLCDALVEAGCEETTVDCSVYCAFLTSGEGCDAEYDALFECANADEIACSASGDPIPAGCESAVTAAGACTVGAEPNPEVADDCTTVCEKEVALDCSSFATELECVAACEQAGSEDLGCAGEWTDYLTCAVDVDFVCEEGVPATEGCADELTAYRACAEPQVIEQLLDSDPELLAQCEDYCEAETALECSSYEDAEQCLTSCQALGSDLVGCETEWQDYLDCSEEGEFVCSALLGDMAMVEACLVPAATALSCVGESPLAPMLEEMGLGG